MGLNTFSTALSGLFTNSEGLNVVGNNLANMNTVAYKSSNITFTDVLGQAVAGVKGSNNVGLGAQIGAVTPVFSQGGFQTTNNPTDAAIQGKGFFIVKDDGGAPLYTRAGNFVVNADGNLVNPAGYTVQGFARNPVTGAIDMTGAATDIRLPATTGFSKATTEFELAFNLDSSAAIGSTFQSSVQIYDSLGAPHLATIAFVKVSVASGETRWAFDVTVPRTIFEGVPATSTEKFSLISGAVASATADQGTIVFDDRGKMISVFLGAEPATLPAPGDLALPLSGVTMPAQVNGGALLEDGLNWKFVSGNGSLNATGLASASAVTFNNQNGVPPGTMTSMSIQSDGTIFGTFSNGLTQEVARIAIAQFRSESGMISRGGGLFAGSAESGSVLLGVPGEGGNGRLVGGTLELSNVDLASEFTKIITYQRAYQANARIISVTDQILQETLNLRQ